jgi:hypothetical protein
LTFGQGNDSVSNLHQPPIRISSPQGKMYVHKCVCADVLKRLHGRDNFFLNFKIKNKKFRICADRTSIHADAKKTKKIK